MKKGLVSLAAILVSTGAVAETKPFNLSLTPDVAVYDRSETIKGVTLSVWGENPQTSLALGIVNGTVGNSAGLSWGFILNYAEAADAGEQVGLVNIMRQNTQWFKELPDKLAPAMVFVNWRF